MTDAVEKICNFSCSCVRDDCSYKHQIDDLENRKKFKEIYDKLYDKDKHRETDPEGKRMKNCFNGYLCKNKDCGFKHFCSFDGRFILTRAWYKELKKVEAQEIIKELDNLKGHDELVEKLKKFLLKK